MQRFDRVVLVLLGNLIDTHHAHGTCQICLALHGVACHHHLVEQFGIFFKHHVHRGLRLEHLGLVAHKGDGEGALDGNGQGEMTIEVGSNTIAGASLHHGGSQNRFVEHILGHGTFHGDGLTPREQRYHQSEDTEEDFVLHNELKFLIVSNDC